MISSALRMWLYALAAGYGAMGAILFVAPNWAANNFAWRISPFVAMTIGGWCIGTAFACLIVARRGNWSAMICPILYLALFGLFESAVLVAFRDRLLIANPLAWLYCGVLAGTCLFAIAAAFEAMRRRLEIVAVGPPLGATAIGSAVVFIAVVGFLGTYGLTAVQGMRGLNASIFPEQISPFSLRAFGAFYFALALAVIPLLWARGIGNLVSLSAGWPASDALSGVAQCSHAYSVPTLRTTAHFADAPAARKAAAPAVHARSAVIVALRRSHTSASTSSGPHLHPEENYAIRPATAATCGVGQKEAPSGGVGLCGAPLMRTLPRDGLVRPARNPSSVDFPHSDGPTDVYRGATSRLGEHWQ